MPPPLQNILILDCSTLLPGPFVGRLLHQLGARVIKIENPDSPDGSKRMGKTYWRELNQEKEIVELNLKIPAARKIFEKYVKCADGLIEGFRPAAKQKLGLDSTTLHGINPNLCICSLTGYPEGGPEENRAGHEINFQARSGALSMTEGMPGLPLADLACAWQAALSLVSDILAVKIRKSSCRRTVSSMYESLTESQNIFISEFRQTKISPTPGNTFLTGLYPCYQIYLTQDRRRVSVGALEEKFWDIFCKIIGIDPKEHPRLAQGEEGARIRSMVQERLETRTWSEWEPLFEQGNCCVEVVRDYREIFSGIQS